MTTTFETGRVYTTGEGRDYVWHFEVLERTAKFITIQDVSHGRRGKTSRVGALATQDTSGNDTEYALPLGRYSMAPTIEAGDAVISRVRGRLEGPSPVIGLMNS
jgi:hypothetical protein